MCQLAWIKFFPPCFLNVDMHWCLSQPIPTSSGSVPSDIMLSRFLVNSVFIILCLQLLLTNCLLFWTTCHFSCQQYLPLLSHLPWFPLMIAVSSLMCHHFKNLSVFSQRLRNHRLPCGHPSQRVLLGLAVSPASCRLPWLRPLFGATQHPVTWETTFSSAV